MIYTVIAHLNARQPRVEKRDEKTYEVWVSITPEGGKANAAVVEALAAEFGVAKSRVRILRGHTIRLKHVAVDV